ncbi:Hsp33 family molecular chaperone HslO [bacterium]|nr:Hsp33 family molecular chaperone HslO [bacterium]
MKEDYLLIAVDAQKRVAFRFLCLNHAVQNLIQTKKIPDTFKKSFGEFVLASVVLGSRSDNQETKLFKAEMDDKHFFINAEISPLGPFRVALFPRESVFNINLQQPGLLRLVTLNKKDDVYQTVEPFKAFEPLSIFRNFLTHSVQTEFCLQLYSEDNAHYALWVEKLPDTTTDEWNIIKNRFETPGLFLQSFKNSDDPDGIMNTLLDPGFKILAVTKPVLACSCSREAFIKALKVLPQTDLVELFMDGKGVSSICDYCGKEWTVTDKDLQDVLKLESTKH